MAELTLLSGAGPKQSFPLGDNPLLIGRHSTCHVQLWDPKVSREHARIEKRVDGYYVVDLGSRNGTYVNDVPIQAQRLNPGDQIKVGDTLFAYIVQSTVSFTEPSPGVPVTMVDRSLRTQDAKLIDQTRSIPDTASVHNAQMAVMIFHRLAELATAAQETSGLLNGAMSLAIELVGADRGFISLAADKPEFFVVKAWHPATAATAEISLSNTILEHTVKRGEAILCNDIQSDSRFTGQASIKAHRMKSAIYVPMKVGNRIIGILGVDTPDPKKRFSAEHLNFLTIFSNHLAVALQNVQLREQAEQQRLIDLQLQTARNIQASFLPSEQIRIHGLEYAAKMLPAMYVGGDFYDWILLNDGRIAFAIGDVSGKGIPAALTMARLMGCLRGITTALSNPSEILAALNKSLFDSGGGGTFTTLALAVFDPIHRTLDLSIAGHLPPIVFTQSKRQGQIISGDFGLPLGILKETEWTRGMIHLSQDDLIVFYTDGIVEAGRKAPDIVRLQRAIQNMVDSPLEHILDTILATVAPDDTRHDDATLLAMRVV